MSVLLAALLAWLVVLPLAFCSLVLVYGRYLRRRVAKTAESATVGMSPSGDKPSGARPGHA